MRRLRRVSFNQALMLYSGLFLWGALATTLGGGVALAQSVKAKPKKRSKTRPEAQKPEAQKERKKKARAAKKAKVKTLLLTMAPKDGVRGVFKLNLETDKVEPLLYDKSKKKEYQLLNVSPNGKVGVVEAGGKVVLYDFVTRKPIKQRLETTLAQACFFDDSTVLRLEVEPMASDPKLENLRLVKSDLRGSTRHILYQSRGYQWGRVPLRLSPNKKFVSYYATTEYGQRKCLTLVRLKDGRSCTLPERYFHGAWSSDCKTFYSQDYASDCFVKFSFDGQSQFGPVDQSSDVQAVFLKNLGQGRFLGLMTKPGEREQSLVVMDESLKVLAMLSKTVENSSELYKYGGAYDPETKTCYFVERDQYQENEASPYIYSWRLVAAQVKNDRLTTRRVILNGEESLWVPFLGPTTQR